MLAAVNYHYIRPCYDLPYTGIHGLTPAQFDADLQRLSAIGEFVSADQVRQAVHGRGTLPERAVLITFDDGFREQVEHALPVLARHSVPAICFVNPGPIASGRVSGAHKVHLLRSHRSPAAFAALVEHHARVQGISLAIMSDPSMVATQYPFDEPDAARIKYLLNFALARSVAHSLIDACFADVVGPDERDISRGLYMDIDQLCMLDSLGYLGTHADEHVPLGLLPDDEVRVQVRTSRERLRQWTGRAPFAMSYPYGSPEACSPAAGRIAAEEGVEFAFTMNRAPNQLLDSPLFLNRYDAKDVPSEAAAAALLLFGSVCEVQV